MAILRKKGTLGSQWQSLINSRKTSCDVEKVEKIGINHMTPVWFPNNPTVAVEVELLKKTN